METFTQEEVACILKVSEKTVIREMNKGKLPYFRVGSRRRVSEEQLRHYMDNTPRPAVKPIVPKPKPRGRSEKGLTYKVFDPV